MGNGAVTDFLIAAIADIRGFVQSVIAFLFKIGACLVTGGAGSAFDTTENDLATGIGFSAVITVDTEVLGIVKSTLMILVRKTMCFHFFRDGSRIFAQVFGNVGEHLFREFSICIRSSRVRCFWLPGIYLLIEFPPTAVRRRYNRITNI